jgi:O-antigen/teichoic acid export membrane protein
VSQLKKGAFLNYTTIILTNIVGLIMTPLIINSIGASEYGIYLTMGAIVGTISLLDFGLNNTVVRFVAKYRAEKNKEEEENFLATVMLIFAIISIIVVLLGVIFYVYFIDSYFTKLDNNEIQVAKTIFKILIFNLAIGLPGAAFTGICYGYEVFVFPKTLNIIKYILRSLTVVVVLLLGGKAISLVVIDTIFNVSLIGITFYYITKKLSVRFKLHNFSKSFIKEIFSYSTWIFVFAIVGFFQWRVGHWVLGNLSTAKVLAIYGIGITLGTYYGAFSTAISSVFLPRATQMSVNKASNEELTSMMIKIGRISFIVLMYVFGAFLLYGKQFVTLWVGKELGYNGSNQTWFIAILIMVAYTLPLVQGFGNSILEAKSKLRFKAVLYLSFLLLGTALGAFLAKKHDALGMIIGSVTGWFIAQNIMNFYYHNTIKLNIIRFFKELLNKTLLVFLLILIVGYLINCIPGNNWFNFIIKAVLYSFVYFAIMYSQGTIAYEKQLIKQTFSPFISKLKK